MTSSDRLKVISQGDIKFSGQTDSRAQLIAGGDIEIKGNATITGRAYAKGDIEFKGKSAFIAANDAPIVGGNRSVVVAEDSGSTALNIQLPTDPDEDLLTIKVTELPDAAKGQIQLADGRAVAISQTLSLTELQSITFVASADANGEAGRFSYTADDGWCSPSSQTIELQMTPVNDGPIISAPSALTIAEDTTLSFTSGLTIRDIDAGDRPLIVELSVGRGQLQTSIGAAGQNRIALSGTLDELNQQLSQLTYRADANYAGTDALTILVNDQGNTGAGGELSDRVTIDLTILAVNDAPVLTAPTLITATEDTSVLIQGLQVADVDAADKEISVQLKAGQGTLSLSQQNGLSFQTVSDSELVFQGTVEAINAALGSLSYLGAADYAGSDTLQFTVNDLGNTGEGGPLSQSRTIELVIVPANDAPVLSAPEVVTLLEDSLQSITGLQVSDVDANGQEIQIQLSVGEGTLQLSQRAGLDFQTNTASNLLFKGTVSAINAALGSLSYQGAADYAGTDTLLFSVSDLGNTGEGGAQSQTRIVDLQVVPVNDGPVIIAPEALTLSEDTSLSFLSVLQIQDIDAGELPLQVTLSTDRGSLQIGDSVASIKNNLVLRGSLDELNAQLNQLKYQPDTNYVGEDTLTIVVSDQGNTGTGGELSATVTVALTVTPINDAPVLTGPTSITIPEDIITSVSGLQVADVDAGDSELSVRLSVGQGTLFLSSESGLSFSTRRADELVFQGSANAINNALRNLRYQGAPNYAGVDALLVEVNDLGNTGEGGALSQSHTVELVVTAVNDAPILSSPTVFSLPEDSLQSISGLQVSDVDTEGDGEISVRLSVEQGALQLDQQEGLSFQTNEASELIFQGTVAAVNVALSSLSYQGAANFAGSDKLLFTVNDLGNTGAGGALSQSREISLQVTPVNDGPVIAAPNALTLPEDTTLSFLSVLQVQDVDAGDLPLQASLSVNYGSLRLEGVEGSGQSSIVLIGSVSELNAQLSQVQYQPDANYIGTDALTLTVTDQGNTGAGGELSGLAVVDLIITPVNDAPILSGPDSISVAEETSQLIEGLLVADVDAGDSTLFVRLSTNEGTLSLQKSQGLSFQTGSAEGAAKLVFEGTLAAINDALSTLSYTGVENYTGTDSLLFEVSDSGDGSDAPLLSSLTTAISVVAVNDPPVISAPNSIVVSEDTDLSFQSLIQVSDADADELTVTLSTSGGTLRIGNDADFQSSLTLTGSPVEVNSKLSNVIYRGAADFAGTDSLSIVVSDGEASQEAIVGVAIAPVNDAPIISAPTEFALSEDSVAAISNISIADIDAADAEIDVSLSVGNGTIGLGLTDNLTVSVGSATETSFLQFSGTLDAVNQALSSLTYKGNANFTGDDALTISVSDLGNTGDGGALVDSVEVAISITPVNDAPTISSPSSISVESGQDGLVESIQFADIDAGTGKLELQISVGHGILRLANSTAITFLEGSIDGASMLKVSGTLESLNDALTALIYRSESGYSGSDQIDVTINDLGNTGDGGSLEATTSVNVEVVSTGVVLEPEIVLKENNDFVVVAEKGFVVPENPSVVQFAFTDLFDTSTSDGINDAFEVALLDSQGLSLVHTFSQGKDTFFNLSEGIPAAQAAGVTIAGQTVTVDISDITSGTEANLVFRLINNDLDTETTINIENIQLLSGGDAGTISVAFKQGQTAPRELVNFKGLEDVSGTVKAEYSTTSYATDGDLLYVETAIQNVGTYSVSSPLIVAVKGISDPSVSAYQPDGFTPDGLPYYDFSNLSTGDKLNPNDITATRDLVFYNPNEVQFSYDLVVLSSVNQGPTIESTPVSEVIQGQPYQYLVEAKDSDSDSITYKLVVSPEGMSIDAESGLIEWSATDVQLGSQSVLVEVSDGRGGISQQFFALSVTGVPSNRPPVFTSTPTVDAYLNQSYRYDSDATDSDQDNLTYELVSGPDGLTINETTGLVEWTPPSTLVLGETVLGQIRTPGEINHFTFSGVAGQKIYLDSLKYSGSYQDWNWHVFSPSGQTVVDDNLSDDHFFTLTETGNYLVAVTLDNGNVGSYGFSILDYDLAPVIDLDTEIKGQLFPGSESDIYRFSGKKGQLLFLDQIGARKTNLKWQLYNSSNKSIASSHYHYSFDDIEYRLPANDEYALVLSGKSGFSDVIDYHFEVITPDWEVQTYEVGNIVSGEITEKGEQDIYTFEGSAGQQLFFDGLSASSSFSVKIYNTDDQVIFSSYPTRDEGPDRGLVFKSDDTYRVVVDGYQEDTGSYAFRLLDRAAATVISVDEQIDGEIEENGRGTTLYSVTLDSSRYIYFDVVSGERGAWELYNSSGQRVRSSNFNYYRTGDEEFTLPADNYLLAVRGENVESAYQLRLITPEWTVEPLEIGETVSGEISEKGERDTYTFEAAAGQQLFFDGLSGDSSTSLRVYNSSNEVIFSSGVSSDAGPDRGLVIKDSDTYRLVVDGYQEGTGSYEFRLLDRQFATKVNLDEDITGKTEKNGKGTTLYSFTLEESQYIYFDAISGKDGRWEIFNSSGRLVQGDYFSSYWRNGDEEFNLSSGEYLLAIRGTGAEESDYRLRMITPELTKSSLVVGKLIEGEITEKGERDTYFFVGTAGQQLFFDGLLGDNPLSVRIYNGANENIFSGSPGSDGGPDRGLVLKDDDTYRVVVDGSEESLGAYAFRLLDKKAASNIVLDESISDQFSRADESKIYNLSITDRQKVSVSGQFDTTRSITWRLYNPSGEYVTSNILT